MIVTINLRIPHKKQRAFIDSPAKRKVIRAGRRGGKTTGIAIYAAEKFMERRRVLYVAPTFVQVSKFWREIKLAFDEPIKAKHLNKNETLHTLERPVTENAIIAKTAWNADTMRGDYGDVLIFDEWQLMNEDAWDRVGAPMLLDNDGDAIFIYTPPSGRSRSISKATDKRHAAKLFKSAQLDASGRWATFHFPSHENPHISAKALSEITGDMTALAYRQEIMAEDIDEVPGALWTRQLLDKHRCASRPELARVVVAIDPAVTSGETSDETGIVVCGIDNQQPAHGYVLQDATLRGSPSAWAKRAIAAYYSFQADRVIGEVNNGGEMIEHTLRMEDASVSYKAVRASRGKYVRAEPISALYEQGRIHHVGEFPDLEDQLCSWLPGDDSPDRLDAAVWAFSELMLNAANFAMDWV